MALTIIDGGLVKSWKTGGSFIPLTNKQLMDLMSAKKQIVEASKKDKKKTFYLNIDDEGECEVAAAFHQDSTVAAYKNGSEVPIENENQMTKTAKTAAVSKEKATVAKDRKPVKKYMHELKIGDKFTVGGHKTTCTLTKNPGYGTYPFSYKDSRGIEYGSTTNLEVKKAAAKKSAKKGEKKTPEGKKMTISVKKAIELAKKGARVYRASNGSDFGLYYLDKVKNKDREMELIVHQ